MPQTINLLRYDTPFVNDWRVGLNGVVDIVKSSINAMEVECDVFHVRGENERLIAQVPAWKVTVVFARPEEGR